MRKREGEGEEKRWRRGGEKREKGRRKEGEGERNRGRGGKWREEKEGGEKVK